MKAIGVTRRIDSIGRIIIPKELRDEFKLEHRTEMELYVDEDALYMKKYYPKCVFCGVDNNVIEYKGKNICIECIEEMKAL